jgi:predicted dehydrogenase
VFSEKPAATTLDNLTELKKAYAESGKIYSSMMALRFAPGFIAAKEFADAGGIGEIRLVHAQKSYKLGTRGDMYKNKKLYGGTIPWVGSHAVDWIYYFTKKKFANVFAAQSRIANCGHGDLEMTAACNFVLEDEIIATANIDYLRPDGARTHGDDRIRIVGTLGIVEVRDGEAFAIANSGERKLPNTKETHIFDEFIKAVKGEKNELPKAEDAFYVTEVCLKARLSAETGGIIEI